MNCGKCGVEIARSRDGRLIHVGSLPDRVEYHDAVEETPEPEITSPPDLEKARIRVHQMRATMRDPVFSNVVWTDIARDAVALLDQLEILEKQRG